ncbi:nucleobase:cation symporter [Burkholderia sp. MSh2]|uniref:Nucleobase:cation symporter n=1 Tax=Burkholderia paludis TaxID=1506587 RepID=A0A6J5F5A2_9BURK|nr:MULTISPECIES: uracil-xanthine permease family protein [Burkholderia]KEZ01266.1 nucleobase:cation symporter [Burkholderia sp. MSh2]CAB3773664.1 Nucleobase transporter PlUacP [Burkholderia paludis]VWC17682.1 nucleobase:cation symporter [Burkholderia paludis]
MSHDPISPPVDTRLPAWQLVLFGLQHVLSMAASPITAVFLIEKVLALPADLTVQLIGATFFACGIGTLLQSLGAGPICARMPFVMVPGGAPTMLFAGIAAQSGLPVATGAALLASAFYWVLLPVFTRCLRLFPRVVVGAMLLLVSVNLLRIYATIVVGQPGSADFAQPRALGLALATIVATVAVAGAFRGMLGRLAVLIGLTAGATLGWALGAMPAFDDVWRGPLLTHPVWLPFGMPRFDVLAALPLLIFTAISMAEATAQTVAVGETCGKAISLPRDVPKTIRGDAIASLVGALFGTPLIVTSAENIGVVQTTGVRSRYVTAAAGAILIVIALCAPLARLAYAIPAPVVGGTALVVFAMIGVMGIRLLAGTDLHARANQYTLAAALVVGLAPILVPNLYRHFGAPVQIVLGNGMAAGTLAAIATQLTFAALERLRAREGTAATAAPSPSRDA